jgi:hypothetical protein
MARVESALHVNL